MINTAFSPLCKLRYLNTSLSLELILPSGKRRRADALPPPPPREGAEPSGSFGELEEEAVPFFQTRSTKTSVLVATNFYDWDSSLFPRLSFGIRAVSKKGDSLWELIPPC